MRLRCATSDGAQAARRGNRIREQCASLCHQQRHCGLRETQQAGSEVAGDESSLAATTAKIEVMRSGLNSNGPVFDAQSRIPFKLPADRKSTRLNSSH